MLGFLLLASIIMFFVFLYNYFQRKEAIYVSDKRFKTGRRLSHYRSFTTEEIAKIKSTNGKGLKWSAISFVCLLIPYSIFHENDKSEKTQKYTYEIIHSNHNSIVENYNILLNTKEQSKDSIEKILREIKTELCKNKCNISAYDDKNAFDLEEEMNSKKEILAINFSNKKINKTTYKKEIQKIDEEYYVKIGDHLIGLLEFEGEFLYYPLKDWRYKELKKN